MGRGILEKGEVVRIYWHSTAPWSPSSYSVLTMRAVPPIVRAGYEVVLGTWYGLQGQPMPWTIQANGKKATSVRVLPHHQVGGNTYGEAIMVENYRRNECDVMMTVCDVFVFPPEETSKTNFAPWLPIDTSPVAGGIVRALGPAIYPMCYSQFGVDELAKAGINAKYVPCGAPMDVFTPGDKAEARTRFDLGREFDFLVSMIAANKDANDRKGFAVALQGFAQFVERRPEAQAVLYVHTDWGGPIKVGEIAKSLGVGEHVVQPDQYGYIMGMLGEQYMVDVYRASDVLLNPAKSEGFGLPLVEAQMCGCPVIATDFANTDELLSAGWKVGGHRAWYPGAEAWRMEVEPGQIADAMEEAWQERDNPKLREKARKGVAKYDQEAVFEKYWRPALRDIKKLVDAGKSFSLPEPLPLGGEQAE